MERSKTVALGKSYWYISPILWTNYLNIDFCRILADARLCTGCCIKGAAHSFFRKTLWSSYLGQVLLMNFASTWNKLFKPCFSVEFLLVDGYAQGALRKELFNAAFMEHFKTATLERCCWWILPVLGTICCYYYYYYYYRFIFCWLLYNYYNIINVNCL